MKLCTPGDFITQQAVRKKPSRKDYAETTRLLQDFSILDLEIPSFETVQALLRWRSNVIQSEL